MNRTADTRASNIPAAMRTRRGLLLVMSLAVAVAAGVIALVVARSDGLPDDAVLRMGDTTVTQDDFSKRVEVLSALYGVQKPEAAKDQERFQRDAAKSMAVSLIIDQAAADHDVVISDKSARDALDKIVDAQFVGGHDDFVQFLSTSGVSEDDVLDEVRRQLATSRLFEVITADVSPATPDEVRAAFDENREDMATPERRRLANIVTATRREAQQVLRRARAGTDFGQLAKLYSMDGSTQESGGDLGLVTADELDAGFAEAAFAPPVGSLFGPVKTQYGWNVGRVTTVRPRQALSFEQVAKRLEAELNRKQSLDFWRDWLADEIEDADIEYADDYRPTHPDEPPTDAPGATP